MSVAEAISHEILFVSLLSECRCNAMGEKHAHKTITVLPGTQCSHVTYAANLKTEGNEAMEMK